MLAEMTNRTISSGLTDGLTPEQIRRYASRREQDLRVIFSALEIRDTQPIREIAHKIKGNAALYGLEDFGLAAGRLLAVSESEDWSAMESAARAMAETLREGVARYE
jgi:hypothetical protein